MSAVHGVYLKYVLQSLLSHLLLYLLAPEDPEDVGPAYSSLLSLLAYFSFLNGLIAVLFRMKQGMGLLGKDYETGQVPWWSYALFAGFHLPTWLYTRVHRSSDKVKGIACANEVAPGWWVGGRYGDELGKKWGGILDLTCEFPETCKGVDNESYMLLRCWDGVPPTPEQLEQAAEFGVKRHKKGHVIVHCAHGRGRSTTAMCACLVKAGLFKNWQDALAAIQSKRKVCRLNTKMQAALNEWQEMRSSAKKTG